MRMPAPADWSVVRLARRAGRDAHLAALLARRSWHEYGDDHCQQLAAAISYHVLFSIFPLAIAGVGALGLVTRGTGTRDSVIDAAVAGVPLSTEGQQELRDLLVSVGDRAGTLGLLGLAGVVWSATGVMASVRTALNVAWDTDERRPFVRGKAVDLLLMLSVVIPLAAAFGATLLVGLVASGSQRLPGFLAWLAGPSVRLVTLGLTVALMTATFVAVFRWIPAVPTRVREVWPGALVAALGLELLQYGFSVYVSHFAHYDRVYGSLGTVVALLFFVYLASSVFLFGAEVAAEYPRLPDRQPAGPEPEAADPEPGPAGPEPEAAEPEPGPAEPEPAGRRPERVTPRRSRG
jgi:membrane protein